MRRWFQFSLRSLMLLVLVVGAYFGGWKSSQYKYEREMREAARKAAKEMEDLRAANALISPTLVTSYSGGWPYVISTALQPTIQLQPYDYVANPANPYSPVIIWNGPGGSMPQGMQTVDLNGSGRVVAPVTVPGAAGR